MNTDALLEVVKILGPALAAWVSVRITLAVALERADAALREAQRAHARLDSFLEIKQ